MDEPPVSAGNVYRFILGRDTMPVLIPKDEGRRALRDPFARLVLFADDAPPLSLRALLDRLDNAGDHRHSAASSSPTAAKSRGASTPTTSSATSGWPLRARRPGIHSRTS